VSTELCRVFTKLLPYRLCKGLADAVCGESCFIRNVRRIKKLVVGAGMVRRRVCRQIVVDYIWDSWYLGVNN
jgi:hypothetical protein